MIPTAMKIWRERRGETRAMMMMRRRRRRIGRKTVLAKASFFPTKPF
jgi:hypothetical protein